MVLYQVSSLRSNTAVCSTVQLKFYMFIVCPGFKFWHVHLPRYLCLPSSATLGLASCCVGQSSSGVLLLAAPVMSRDRCSLDMLKASDWMPRPSSFKVVLALVLPPLQLAGGSMVVLFFLVMLPAPDDDDDDLRLLDGAA